MSLFDFALLSPRLFSYIIGGDGRLAMPLVFFPPLVLFDSVVFSFGGQVSELLKAELSATVV